MREVTQQRTRCEICPITLDALYLNTRQNAIKKKQIAAIFVEYFAAGSRAQSTKRKVTLRPESGRRRLDSTEASTRVFRELVRRNSAINVD